MDAKDRIQKMLNDGVIGAAQARRLQQSVNCELPDVQVTTRSYHKPIAGMLLGFFLIALGIVFTLNTIAGEHEAAMNRSANLQSQYQRRHDLIPQLVLSIKQFIAHEQSVYRDIAHAHADGLKSLENAALNLEASQKAVNIGTSVDNRSNDKTQEITNQQLRNVLVLAAQFPSLRSGDQFLALQAQIEGSENRINIARLQLNSAVSSYNVRIKQLPYRWLAGIAGYQEILHFHAVDGAERVPHQSW